MLAGRWQALLCTGLIPPDSTTHQPSTQGEWWLPPRPQGAPFSSADLVSPLVFSCSNVLRPESLGNQFSGLEVARQNFSFRPEVHSVDRIVREELSWDQRQTPPTRESWLLKTRWREVWEASFPRAHSCFSPFTCMHHEDVACRISIHLNVTFAGRFLPCFLTLQDGFDFC